MDFQKAKIYLEKLNREFTRMSKDPENIIRIDVDIMASYARELYDAIHSESNNYTYTKAEPAPVRPPVQRAPVYEQPVEMAPPPPPAPVVAEVPSPAPPPPAREEPPAPAPPPPPAPAPPPPTVEAPKPPAPAVFPTSGLDVLFEEKQAKELSEKLAESAISDLKKAIALNDRLMYTSELFAGDGKAFENTLAALNNFSHFEEARNYLVQYCAVHFTWTDKKRVDIAKAFVKLVRRRYK